MKRPHGSIVLASIAMMAASNATLTPIDEPEMPNRKARRSTKATGQPIPDGTVTRQQRRANERRLIKQSGRRP